MSGLAIEILGKVDNGDGSKWTFLQPTLSIGSETNNTIRATFTQMLHPMHNSSEIYASFDCGVTSMHNFPEVQGSATVVVVVEY